MRIGKLDNHTAVAGTEAPGKDNPAGLNKSRSSIGIAAAKNTFETAKQKSLFQDIPGLAEKHSKSADGGVLQRESAGRPAGRSETRTGSPGAASTATIADGTSNTVVVGEQASGGGGGAGAITDGTSNTIAFEEQPADN